MLRETEELAPHELWSPARAFTSCIPYVMASEPKPGSRSNPCCSWTGPDRTGPEEDGRGRFAPFQNGRQIWLPYFAQLP